MEAAEEMDTAGDENKEVEEEESDEEAEVALDTLPNRLLLPEWLPRIALLKDENIETEETDKEEETLPTSELLLLLFKTATSNKLS